MIVKTAKILLVVSVACLLTTVSVLAQGRIAFANTSLSRLYVQSPNVNGGAPVVVGTASVPLFGFGPASMEIQLYAGLTSNSLSPVLIGTAANQQFVLNTSSTLAAAQGTFAGGNPLPLAGFDGSAPVYLQFTVRGVGNPFGDNSPIILVNLATGAAPSTTVFAATPDASHWGPMVMSILEPSALALTGLSFAGMFLARRQYLRR